jgi:hypothetical protein
MKSLEEAKAGKLVENSLLEEWGLLGRLPHGKITFIGRL